EHRNLVNLLYDQYNYTGMDFSRVLQFTTIGFDVAAQEIFSTLLSGGRLSLIAKETLGDIPAMFDLVRRDRIKTLFFPASFLMFTMTDNEYLKMIPPQVRHIVTAGEQVVINDKFRKYLQRENVTLHNHYGPSETHVVTTLTLEPGDEIPVLPTIGKPIANTKIYIIDKSNHLLPQNIAGELIIGGAAVGRGYLNKPELTAERFTLNKSFAELFQKRLPEGHTCRRPPEASFYRTGDLARWQQDGKIEFLGRIDQQVKIRGHRVELGEIENRLLSHPEISEAVVLARQSESGDHFLCAYYVETGTGHPETSLTDYLSKRLPDYMQPSFFIKMEKIPLTPNGKIDRKALSEHQITKHQIQTYRAPRNEIEKKLTEIWTEILENQKEKIGIDDDFFKIGGHSLKAMVMAARVHKEFNVRMPLAVIFEKPTIRALSKTVTGMTRDCYKAVEPAEKKEYYN
ncbi:MAG: AMP-binding protein, partial [bacterium]|nr:AMP-binding protein [bacterium]